MLDGAPPRWWALAVGVLFAGLALALPRTLAPLNRLWFLFGQLLHRIVNPIVMGLLFFCVLTPTALLMRLLGKRALALDFDAAARTYWIERRPPGPAPETMKRQF